MSSSPLSLLRRADPKSVDDAEIAAIGRSDRDRGFEMLLAKYRDRIYQHALYITKDSEGAFDVAQDVFVRGYHEPRLFDEDFRAKAWLFRVCTNRCYNIVRDRKRRRNLLEKHSKSNAGLRESHQAINTVLDKELSEGMGRALATLSADHRTILTLRYYHDLSYEEIALSLEIKLGTVMSRLSRAKLRLHDALVAEGER